MRIGWTEILVILALVLILFGAKRLPELARSLGRSLKEFKKGTRDLLDDEDETTASPAPPGLNDKKKVI